jgi:hypothetical protein
VVFGTLAAVLAALAVSLVSAVVNTVFIERHNGSDRNRNRRKVRKTCCFSKDWPVQEARTYFTMYSYNFCWPVRTLRVQVGEKGYQQRTPAMAAGLTGHRWTMLELLRYQVPLPPWVAPKRRGRPPKWAQQPAMALAA